jgi:hypothetical protein
VTRSPSRWIPLISLAVAAPLAACGSSTSGTGSTSTPTASASAPATASGPTPTATTASAACPTGATIGSALGITVPDAVGIAPPGINTLPGGATGIVCDYHGAGDNVIVEVLTNINPSFMAQFTKHFVGTVKSVPGLGDQATSFFDPLNGGTDNEGVVATKGSTLVSVGATATPATLNQVEALVNSLL